MDHPNVRMVVQPSLTMSAGSSRIHSIRAARGFRPRRDDRDLHLPLFLAHAADTTDDRASPYDLIKTASWWAV